MTANKYTIPLFNFFVNTFFEFFYIFLKGVLYIQAQPKNISKKIVKLFLF